MGSLPTYSDAGSVPRALQWGGVEKVLLEDFDDGHASYSKESGTYTNTTTLNLTGSQSIQIALAAGENGSVRKASYSLDLSRYWGFGVKIYLPEETARTGDHSALSLTLLFSDSSGFTNFYSGGWGLSTTAKSDVNLEPGWNFLTLRKADFSATGTLDWNTTTFQMVRVRGTLTGGTGTKSFVVDSVYGLYGYRPSVLMTFDDGAATVYTNALPIMEDYGLTGTAFVIGSEADTAANMTTDEMLELQNDYGWTLGNHGWASTAQTSLTLAEVEADIVDNQEWMIANGMRGYRYWAYPNGEYSWSSKAITDKYHDLCRTSLNSANQHKAFYGNERACRKLIRMRSVGDSDAASVQIAHVNTAVSLGQSCHLNFHNIQEPGDTGTGYANSAFTSLCQHIAKLRDGNVLDVMTYEEYDRSFTTPRWRHR